MSYQLWANWKFTKSSIYIHKFRRGKDSEGCTELRSHRWSHRWSHRVRRRRRPAQDPSGPPTDQLFRSWPSLPQIEHWLMTSHLFDDQKKQKKKNKVPGPGTCPSSTETTSCQKKHRFSKNEKTTLKFHLDSWPRDTTSSRFSMRPSCEGAQWKSSPPLTSISPTFLPWFVLLLPCRLGITQTGNKNPKEWEIWEEWPPCLHSLCSRINETVPVHGHKPSRNRFTESHWICTDCTVLHRHIHSRCSITVLQNRPKDPKAAHSPWSWICEPNHLRTRRRPKWPSQKPQRARCATPLRRDTRLRDLRRVSSLWQGLGEKQRPWRFERVPQPLKNGRVPIKKKTPIQGTPLLQNLWLPNLPNKSASKLQGLAKQIGICARLSSLPPWSSWICAPLLWFL